MTHRQEPGRRIRTICVARCDGAAVPPAVIASIRQSRLLLLVFVRGACVVISRPLRRPTNSPQFAQNRDAGRIDRRPAVRARTLEILPARRAERGIRLGRGPHTSHSRRIARYRRTAASAGSTAAMDGSRRRWRRRPPARNPPDAAAARRAATRISTSAYACTRLERGVVVVGQLARRAVELDLAQGVDRASRVRSPARRVRRATQRRTASNSGHEHVRRAPPTASSVPTTSAIIGRRRGPPPRAAPARRRSRRPAPATPPTGARPRVVPTVGSAPPTHERAAADGRERREPARPS